jgi:hypothetical protein
MLGFRGHFLTKAADSINDIPPDPDSVIVIND